jgi:hypothetical protein
VVLHTMDQSKLGCAQRCIYSKLNTLDKVSMQIIVDGSQLRLDPKDIQNYLNKGYIVTIQVVNTSLALPMQVHYSYLKGLVN